MTIEPTPVDDHVTSASQIPSSNYGYVVCTDKYMSGWGWAEGLDNVLIFPVDNHDERRAVEDALTLRPEMIRVRFNMHPPRIREHWFAQVKTRETARFWFRYATGVDA